MESLKRLLIGVAHSPQVVATFRAFVLYALPLAAGALIVWIGTNHDPRWAWLVGLVPLIRVLEGALIDQIKPHMNDVNPPPIAGGADPAALH